MNELINIEKEISELMINFGKLVENVKKDPENKTNEKDTFKLAN